MSAIQRNVSVVTPLQTLETRITRFQEDLLSVADHHFAYILAHAAKG